ncbi:MAG: hypothetical protein IKP22_11885 [Clostridia bacterium]|nr:hypothetical protein [Clostridia bacterium]
MDLLIRILFQLLFQVPIPRLIFVAVLPSVLLIRYVWKNDRLEPEPPKPVRSLVCLGVLSVVPVMGLEPGRPAALNALFEEDSPDPV